MSSEGGARVDYARLAGRDLPRGDRSRITVLAQLRNALARLKTRRSRLQDELHQLESFRTGPQHLPDVLDAPDAAVATAASAVGASALEASLVDVEEVLASPSKSVEALASVSPSVTPVPRPKQKRQLQKSAGESVRPPLVPKEPGTKTKSKRTPKSSEVLLSYSPLHAIAQRFRKSPGLDELIKDRQKIQSKLQEFQSSAGKRMNRGKEPPRTKTHWDYLLEEMEWMARDFRQEHTWKLALAKRSARSVQRTLERKASEAARTFRQEVLRKRKLAAVVSKAIKVYWANIGRLVQYQAQVAVESRKKQSRSRHLDFLLGQTEKFSSLIAMDLQQQSGLPFGSDDEEQAAAADSSSSAIIEDVTDMQIHTEVTDDGSEEIAAKRPSDDELEAVNEVFQDEEDSGAEQQQLLQSTLGAASSQATVAQPTGSTLSSTTVKTTVPSLLRFGQLREYQHIGLDWLVSMYEHGLNVILADEMGLGKTIMTIALLAHLAGERGIWGPHLIIVPTSVLVNWEMEFKRWLPGFKIVCYYGNAKERRQKRAGWSKPNAFHVVITSYKLAIADQHVFRRRRWYYLILDEAQYIKNFRSQRWQVLINLKTQRRLLLTGTPLQNSLMELWSLMHFLMPHVFESQKEFREWFSDPVNQMLEGNVKLSISAKDDIIPRLHQVLRPFLLRRLKSEVASQLPQKHEHVVYCRLSRRQRRLYEDLISGSDAKRTMSSGSYISLMNLLMQLRKVCNHPDLFSVRPVLSPFFMESLCLRVPSLVVDSLAYSALDFCSEDILAPISRSVSLDFSSWNAESLRALCLPAADLMSSGIAALEGDLQSERTRRLGPDADERSGLYANFQASADNRLVECRSKLGRFGRINTARCNAPAACSLPRDLINLLTILHPLSCDEALIPHALSEMILPLERRSSQLKEILVQFQCGVDAALAAPPVLVGSLSAALRASRSEDLIAVSSKRYSVSSLDHLAYVNRRLSFPDPRLVQYDCGKLQMLAVLLRQLRDGGHRVLIFAQMTRMLDVLETFVNVQGYMYLRLDGSTKVDERQRLMERFNNSDRIFLFLLSTRSGGLGINLTGADSVVFYDTDWNPAMDLQAQDRCHRIGQQREVHIYRLVCRDTVEENILKKANQKRLLGRMVIGDGAFTTEYFKAVDPRELLGLTEEEVPVVDPKAGVSEEEAEKDRLHEIEVAMSRAEDEQDRHAAHVVMAEQRAQIADFDEKAAAMADVEAFRSRLEASLKPVEIWSLKEVENINPILTEDRIEELDRKINEQEKQWQAQQQQRLRETQERRRRSREEFARMAAGIPPKLKTPSVTPLSTSPVRPRDPFCSQVAHDAGPASTSIANSVHGTITKSGESEAAVSSEISAKPGSNEDDIAARTSFAGEIGIVGRVPQLRALHTKMLTGVARPGEEREPDDLDEPVLFFVRAGSSNITDAQANAQLDAVRRFAQQQNLLFDMNGDLGSWKKPMGILKPPPPSQIETYVPKATAMDDDPNDPALWGLFVTPEALTRMFHKKRPKKKSLKRARVKRARPPIAEPSPVSGIKIRIPRSKIPGYKSLKRKASAIEQPPAKRVAIATPQTVPTPAIHKAVAAVAVTSQEMFPWSAMAISQPEEAALPPPPPHPLAWSREEDAQVLCSAALFGENWAIAATTLQHSLGVGGRLRTARQCADRYAVLRRRGKELEKVWPETPRPPFPADEPSEARKLAQEYLQHRAEHQIASDSSAMLQRIGRATQNILQHNFSCQRALRAPITGRSAPISKEALLRCHTSHARALAEAHRLLNIPDQSIGATLSPRQIIELRALRDRQGQNPTQAGNSNLGQTTASRPSPSTHNAKMPTKATSRRQNSAKKSSAGSKNQNGPASPAIAKNFNRGLGNSTPARVISSPSGKSHVAPSPKRPKQQHVNRAAAISSSNYYSPREGAQRQSDGTPPLPTTHFLRYVLQQQPGMKERVVEILQRQDWSQAQKFEKIAGIFKQAKARSSAVVAAQTTSSLSPVVSVPAVGAGVTSSTVRVHQAEEVQQRRESEAASLQPDPTQKRADQQRQQGRPEPSSSQ